MIGVEAGLGILVSLIAFLRSEVSGRHSKEAILAALNESAIIQRYLEWLRRQDQAELLRQIEASKTELLTAVAELGPQLQGVAAEVWRVAADLEDRLRELNERVLPPVLSPISLPNRPRANIPIKGRDRELAWLDALRTDALVWGQPGSGKTEVLQSFARLRNARFLVTDTADTAIGALLAGPPDFVIIDDAATRQNLIQRLIHLREERRLAFRIIAVCWPFEKDELARLLRLPAAATLELEGLSRPIIAGIITEIATSRNLRVNDQFVRVVAKQARGKPGLATSLSLAAFAAPGESLVSGELLLIDLGPVLVKIAGDQASHVLAAFACGGNKGVSVESVARELDKPTTEITVLAQKIALAGVLEQTGKDTLCVQPDFLRSALIKEIFFPAQGVALRFEICERLIKSAVEPALGYLELILARGRADATIDNDLLRKITRATDDIRLWEAMSWLDASNCEWALEIKPDLSPTMKRAVLHYHPKRIIPAILSAATADHRPLNAYPDADMRILEDWVCGGWADEGTRRRRILCDSVLAWLKDGGDRDTALAAMQRVFNLEFHETDSDPADPRTFRWRTALLPLKDARAVFGMWAEILPALRSVADFPWRGLVSLVDGWMHSGRLHRQPPPEGYTEFLDSSARQMISDVIPLAGDNQAVLRWAHLRTKEFGMATDSIPVSADFLVLFPEERLEGDVQDIWKEQVAAAHALAATWQNRPFTEIVETLSQWEQQAGTLDRVWPRTTFDFCAKLAEIRDLSKAELGHGIAQLPADLVGPFVEAALGRGQMDSDLVQQALSREDLHGLFIRLVLTERAPHLYPELESRFTNWKGAIDMLCIRGEVPENVLRRLLAHSDTSVRTNVAFHMFRAKGGIPADLQGIWRNAMIDGLIHTAQHEGGECPYDIEKILASDPTLAQEVLDRLVKSSREDSMLIGMDMLPHLVARLGKEDRRALLRRCTEMAYTELPVLLVENDEDLYRELLDIPELKHCHLMVLSGDPNDGNWTALAKAALTAGYPHRTIAHAVESRGFSWTGGLSTYYQQLVERFQRLRQNPDTDIQKIADEGLKWATLQRDRERTTEKREEIYGWD